MLLVLQKNGGWKRRPVVAVPDHVRTTFGELLPGPLEQGAEDADSQGDC